MYPNEASQAILDAKQLYLSFRKYGLSSEALQPYEDIRRPETNEFVLSGRNYGAHKILKIIDELSSNQFNQLSDVISQEEIQNILSYPKQMFGCKVQSLNNQSTL